MLTIAADPKHLGARIGITVGAAHLGLGDDASSARAHDRAGRRHLAGRRALDRLPAQLLPARAGALAAVPAADAGEARRRPRRRQARLLRRACRTSPTPRPSPPSWRRSRGRGGSSTPSARSPGPKAVLAYLSRYTHRVAISNSRLIAADATSVTFKVKDYRVDGPGRYKTMTLATRRVHPPLPHPRPAKRLPPHPPLRPARQRRPRPSNIARRASCWPCPGRHRSRDDAAADDATDRCTRSPCPCCGGRMIIIETFERRLPPRISHPAGAIRIDTS